MILVNKVLKIAYSTSKQEVVIGRAPECDLQMNYPTISKRHVVLKEESGEWYVEDQASANLTYVNGEKVHKPRVLKSGDYLRLDVYTIVFFLMEPPQLPEIVVNDSSGSVRHRLPITHKLLSIGRSLVNNHIAIDDPRVSGQHCSLERKERRWLVIPAKAEAAVKLNQQKIDAPAYFQAGDKVQLGNSTLEISAPIVREWGAITQVQSRLQDLYKSVRVQARTVEDALHENFPAAKGDHQGWIRQVLDVFDIVNSNLLALQQTAEILRALIPDMTTQDSDSVILTQALRDSRRSTNLCNYLDLFLRDQQLVRIQTADMTAQKELIHKLHQDVLNCIQQDNPTGQLR